MKNSVIQTDFRLLVAPLKIKGLLLSLIHISLYQQYLQAMTWLESKLQVAYKIEGAGPREEIWEIPLTVFKEAIINALSPVSYTHLGASARAHRIQPNRQQRKNDFG